MEDIIQPTAKNVPSSPPTGRFMDIQGPSAAQQTSQPPEQPQEPETAPEVLPEETSPDPERASASEINDAPEPAAINENSDSNNEIVMAEPAPDPQTPIDQPTSDAPEPTLATADTDSAPVATEHHDTLPAAHQGTPVVAIIIAVLFAVAVTGLVIFMYLRSKNNNSLGTNTPNSSQATVAKPLASPEDIDQTTTDIDQTLTSADEAADFPEAEISDQTLGL